MSELLSGESGFIIGFLSGAVVGWLGFRFSYLRGRRDERNDLTGTDDG